MSRFSLIVATLGRDMELGRLFKSLSEQTFKDFSVTLVDQNDDDRLIKIVDEYRNFFHIEWVRVNFKNVSKARSLGLEYIAKEVEIVAFPDDDCVYAGNTLERVWEHFCKVRFSVLAGVNIGLNDVWSEKRKSLRKLNSYNVFFRGPTYVFFYNIQAIKLVGGFDENLGPSEKTPYLSGEDTDYSIRCIKLNANSYRDWHLEIKHPEFSIENDSSYHKCLGYAIGRRRILEKHDYSYWFKLLNLAFPLFKLVRNIGDSKLRKYYLIEFVGRLG